MTSPTSSDRRSVAIAWAIATVVVALVVGVLGFTWMNRQDPGPAAAGDPAPTTATEPAPTAEPTTDTDAPTTGEAGPEDEADDSPTLSPEQEEYLLGLQRRDPDDVAALGAVDAPVVIIEYADYRCPFCARWSREVKPELQPYLDDGSVRLEYRDLILFGEESEATAVAARAAGLQDRYWEFHDAVAAAAPPSGHPDMPRERLLELAGEAGVPDLAQFEADLDDPDLSDAVTTDREEAQRLGVTSTPSFLVNTTPVVGAQPAEVFVQIIERELATSRG